jgi:hypothetical protein
LCVNRKSVNPFSAIIPVFDVIEKEPDSAALGHERLDLSSSIRLGPNGARRRLNNEH